MKHNISAIVGILDQAITEQEVFVKDPMRNDYERHNGIYAGLEYARDLVLNNSNL